MHSLFIGVSKMPISATVIATVKRKAKKAL